MTPALIYMFVTLGPGVRVADMAMLGTFVEDRVQANFWILQILVGLEKVLCEIQFTSPSAGLLISLSSPELY